MNSDPFEQIRSVDASGELDAVLALPDHLRDALWRIESAQLSEHDGDPEAIVCGMGGSAIGGDLAVAAFGDRLLGRMQTVRGYGLPAGATTGALVLCSSYSGQTEETLACYAAAEALGASRIAATTGGKLADQARRDEVPVIGLPAGLQPRAAVGYMFAVAAEVGCLAGVAPGLRTEIDAAAAQLEQERDALAARSAELAERLDGATPIIYGCDLTGPLAMRWKTEINENAKLPAFWSLLPEADHNEVAGWDGAADVGRFAAILLEDGDQHPRERSRFELTAKAIEPHATDVIRIETSGETRTARLLSTLMLGDLVSLQLAARRGVDPSPITAIEALKSELGSA